MAINRIDKKLMMTSMKMAGCLTSIKMTTIPIVTSKPDTSIADS